MRFQKKIVYTQSGTGAAVAEPPAVNELTEQEAVVAAMAGRLSVVEARIAEARAGYTEAARGAALGQLPEDSPSLWLAKISEETIRRDGLASALQMERQRLATIIAQREQLEGEQAAAAHLAEFERLAAEATSAAAEVEKAWHELGAHLWRFDAARDALYAERFRPQHGGEVAAPLQERLRQLRARALNSGRRFRSHIELGEIIALEGNSK